MLLFSFIFLFGCTSDTTGTDDSSIDLPAKDQIDVSYGSHAQQKYDIYLPAGRTAETTKVFIFIHGGGWIGGDKADINSGIYRMKETFFPKYAIVNMNYVLGNILSPGYALPNQTDDIQAVIDQIKAKSQEYHVKPEFILCGNSAGGHLSLFYAYKYRNPEVKAVINIVGPTDFNVPSWTSNPWYGFFGNLVNPAIVPSGMTIGTFASPVTWINSDSVPTLSFYGSADTTVNTPENKASLDAKLNQNNVPNESYIYEGDHNAWAAQPQLSWVLSKSKTFLNTYNP